MAKRLLGVISALSEEFAHLSDQSGPAHKFGGLSFWRGQIAGRDAVFVESGAGKVNAGVATSLLLDRFEKVSETQSLYFDLERTIRFDKLGVQKSLLQIEAALDRKRLIGGERFLPLLDRVAKNETYMHMARERAAALADFFRKDKVKVE